MSWFANKKNTKVFAVVIVLIIILSGVVLCLKRRPLPNPENASKDEITPFVASRDFMKMPEGERHKYMKKLKERGILPYMLEPQDPQMRENFRRHMEMFKQERLRKFYTMSPSEQEKALQEAAQELKSEQAHRSKRKNGSSSNRPSHRKELEGQSPEDRARTVDFAKRLRKYMTHEPNEAKQ